MQSAKCQTFTNTIIIRTVKPCQAIDARQVLVKVYGSPNKYLYSENNNVLMYDVGFLTVEVGSSKVAQTTVAIGKAQIGVIHSVVVFDKTATKLRLRCKLKPSACGKGIA